MKRFLLSSIAAVVSSVSVASFSPPAAASDANADTRDFFACAALAKAAGNSDAASKIAELAVVTASAAGLSIEEINFERSLAQMHVGDLLETGAPAAASFDAFCGDKVSSSASRSAPGGHPRPDAPSGTPRP